MELEKEIKELTKKARQAKYSLRQANSEQKNQVLEKIAQLLVEKQEVVLSANQKDLEQGREKGLSSALLDRLRLTPERISSMAEGVKELVKLEDPVGKITSIWKRPNGLLVGRMRIPLGVIFMIYEARPNVTIESASLCLKSGNAIILRGGSEAFNSNLALGEIITDALSQVGLDPASVQVVPTTDRKAVDILLTMEDYIDLVIPRGGEQLIRKVVEQSRIPVLKHYKGVCHIFVDREADLNKAWEICYNAKVQRPSVCNAMETLLVDEPVAEKFLPEMAKKLESAGVEIRGCEKTCQLIPQAKPATEQDWYEEYLDLILAVRVVKGMDEAIEHIQKYGSDHTEAIITENYSRAMEFIQRVDSSSVMVNASTRFSDGFQYGLGAEIGISTTRLHAYGPMGLEELTVCKFIVLGNGQIREK